MILFIQTKFQHLKDGQIDNVKCPFCSTETTISYSIYRKYFSIIIPIFSAGKDVKSKCDKCHSIIDYKFLGPDLKLKMGALKNEIKDRAPIWMYSGAFLILALFGYGFYDSYQTDINNWVYIKNPKAGDVYYIKHSEKHYTTARVDGVSRTQIGITNNDYEIDLESDINSIDETKNYTKSKDTLDLIQLQALFKDHTIIEIVRK